MRKCRPAWMLPVLTMLLGILAGIVVSRVRQTEVLPEEPHTQQAEGVELRETREQPKEPCTQPQEETAKREDSAEMHRPEQEPRAAECLARLIWGEARGCSTTEQAAVAWCVLNRLDSDNPYYARCETVYDIVTQEGQFAGYSESNPIETHLLALAEDVLYRWAIEGACVGSVGRVLPREYIFFSGNGKVNTFTTQYRGGEKWDWSAESPYTEEER